MAKRRKSKAKTVPNRKGLMPGEYRICIHWQQERTLGKCSNHQPRKS